MQTVFVTHALFFAELNSQYCILYLSHILNVYAEMNTAFCIQHPLFIYNHFYRTEDYTL